MKGNGTETGHDVEYKNLRSSGVGPKLGNRTAEHPNKLMSTDSHLDAFFFLLPTMAMETETQRKLSRPGNPIIRHGSSEFYILWIFDSDGKFVP
ncbi:hypothetical protein M378DRAFT_9559 [Amanita muscaria Koide BX008]|uniref:Uncharacterized protein n=1 Tax=Amanita muscaria (strain Koide BX008) TaxID=946122 RepID=A0A0C2XER6_AMAMK|nr:hypothetical protein M378DRAFT_9559 [Amanita muscaria Koide BX008]